MGVAVGLFLRIPGNIKVSQDQFLAIVKNIFWLDIPVNDRRRLLVQDFQDVQELANQVVDFSGSELVVLQVLVETGRVDVFFDDG